MNDAVFAWASGAAVVGWLALGIAALAPPGRGRAAALVFGGRGVPLALCLVYAGLLITHWGSSPAGGFGSLSAVQTLFSVPGKALGAWVHFLAFDLLVGHWMVLHVFARGRSRWPLALLLPSTFMYGPLGVLLFLGTYKRWNRV